MRIWDIHPGYLNRQSLLGEHREIHAIASIITHHKKGYAHHPETVRWAKFGWALSQRHKLLAAEIQLRGYRDRSAMTNRTQKNLWPREFVDDPFQQLAILKWKYQDKEPGRIPLPDSAQTFWQHHKYSVMARSPKTARSIGQAVADTKPGQDFADLAAKVTETLRSPPSSGGVNNVLQHMWGYIPPAAKPSGDRIVSWSTKRLYREIQRLVLRLDIVYLRSSTALSELMPWL